MHQMLTQLKLARIREIHQEVVRSRTRSRPPRDLYPERVNITWPILTHSMTSMVCRTAYATGSRAAHTLG